MHLVLYRRADCELCDYAEQALADAAVADCSRVELDWTGDLAERYGARVPVLRREDTGAELDWPFDSHAVRRFLA